MPGDRWLDRLGLWRLLLPLLLPDLGDLWGLLDLEDRWLLLLLLDLGDLWLLLLLLDLGDLWPLLLPPDLGDLWPHRFIQN